MSVDSRSMDPRTRLVREKYFCLRPKPLERWLWQQALPPAAERVFWLHWEEGMRSGDWCSQIALRRVAQQCCVDTSTVTRAYQLLKLLGLIQRQDPGRDPANPFQQATAITEVRLPRTLLADLSRSPNRLQINKLRDQQAPVAPRQEIPVSSTPEQQNIPSRAQIQATWGRASGGERSRYFNASRTGAPRMEFDADSRLTTQDRQQLLRQLGQMANARMTAMEHGNSVHPPAPGPDCGPRRLSLFTLAHTRSRIAQIAADTQAPDLLRQVVWAMEEGALKRFQPPLALNIALKKIREGAWTRPNRMPPNWSRLAAVPETCNAA